MPWFRMKICIYCVSQNFLLKATVGLLSDNGFFFYAERVNKLQGSRVGRTEIVALNSPVELI